MEFHLESTSPDHVNTPTPNRSQRENEGKSPVHVHTRPGDFNFSNNDLRFNFQHIVRSNHFCCL